VQASSGDHCGLPAMAQPGQGYPAYGQAPPPYYGGSPASQLPSAQQPFLPHPAQSQGFASQPGYGPPGPGGFPPQRPQQVRAAPDARPVLAWWEVSRALTKHGPCCARAHLPSCLAAQSCRDIPSAASAGWCCCCTSAAPDRRGMQGALPGEFAGAMGGALGLDPVMTGFASNVLQQGGRNYLQRGQEFVQQRMGFLAGGALQHHFNVSGDYGAPPRPRRARAPPTRSPRPGPSPAPQAGQPGILRPANPQSSQAAAYSVYVMAWLDVDPCVS